MGNLWTGILTKYYVRLLINHNRIVTEAVTAVIAHVEHSLE